MNNSWKKELFQAVARTFEELCFLFPDAEMETAASHLPADATVQMAFTGPFHGRLVLAVYGGLVPTIAANMLGEDEVPSLAQQHDALGEVANVICGNVLPKIAGSQAVFQLRPPRIDVAREDGATGPLTPVAEVLMGFASGHVEVQLFAEQAGTVTLGEWHP